MNINIHPNYDAHGNFVPQGRHENGPPATTNANTMQFDPNQRVFAPDPDVQFMDQFIGSLSPITPRTNNFLSSQHAANPMATGPNYPNFPQDMTIETIDMNSESNTDYGEAMRRDRRRKQVRDASCRRRKKQKEEEQFLDHRIKEVKSQIELLSAQGGNQRPNYSDMGERDLQTSFQSEKERVLALRAQVNDQKKELLQKDGYSKLIQFALRRAAFVSKYHTPPPPLPQVPLLVAPYMCSQTMDAAVRQLHYFAPQPQAANNRVYTMGWKANFWAKNQRLHFKIQRPIEGSNVLTVANSCWDRLTDPEKCKELFMETSSMRVEPTGLKNIVATQRIVSILPLENHREMVSIAFRYHDASGYYVGLTSIPTPQEAATGLKQGRECFGWRFTVNLENPSTWKARFLGFCDLNAEKDDAVLSDRAHDLLAAILHWESEVFTPEEASKEE